MTEYPPSPSAVVFATILSAAEAISNRAERRKKVKPEPKPEFPRPQPRGTVAYAYMTHERAPVFKATCKFIGCKETLCVTAPGYKDSEDRDVVAEGLEANGWRRSEFDRKWLCDRHA